ncbi:MAG: hypothetical protein H6811_05475 [Phycisphaeraceae bacterium]|nr:hypothetical protein [Phycisphaeraceae bacterium]
MSPVRVNNPLTLQGDSTMTGPVFGDNSSTSPLVSLGGMLEVDGAAVWNRVTFQGAGPVRVTSGVLSIENSPSSRKLDGVVLENRAVVAQNAVIEFENAGRIENLGEWVLNTSQPVSTDPGASFLNAGVIRSSGGSRSLGIRTTMSGGEIRSESGSLFLTGGGLYTGGTLRAEAGAMLRLSGSNMPSVAGPVQARGDGVFEIAGAAVVIEPAGLLDLGMAGDDGSARIFDALVSVNGVLRISTAAGWEDGELVGTGRVDVRPGATLTIDSGDDHQLRCLLRVQGEAVQTARMAVDAGGVVDIRGTYTLHDTGIDEGTLPFLTERVEVRGVLVADSENGSFVEIPTHILDGGVVHTAVAGDMDSSPELRLNGGRSEGEATIRTTGGQTAITTVHREFEVATGQLSVQGDGVLLFDGGALRATAPCVVEPDSILGVSLASVAGSGGVICDGRVSMQLAAVTSSFIQIRDGGRFEGLVVEFRREDQGPPAALIIEAGGEAFFYGVSLSPGVIANSGRIELRGSIQAVAEPEECLVAIAPGGLLNQVEDETNSISARFTNSGTVEVEAGTLDLTGPFLDIGQQGVLVRGRYIVAPGATIRFSEPLTVLSGDSSLRGGSAGFPTTTIRSLSGGMLTASTYWAMNEGLQNQGTARSEGGRIDAGGQTIDNGGQEGVGVGVLEDVIDPERPGEGGFSCAALNNGGCVRPGGMDAAGPFRLTGDFNQFAAGVIEVELGGLDPIDGHDQVTVSGRASLGGTLDIALIGGFEPGVGDEVVVMTFATGEGTFDLVRSPLLSDGRRLRAVYDATSVRLVSTCGADLDGDGAADASDFFLYLDAFAVGDPLADVTGDGEIDSEDFFSYLDSFAQGGC